MTHYSDDTPLEPFPIAVRVRGEAFTFTSSKGMFSKDALDTGTKLLLESMHLPEKGRVLDLGCGIGVVGILVKKWFPSVAVVQSDVTRKAVTLTRENAVQLRVDTHVVLSDVYESVEGVFDAILTNPPRAAGKDVIRKMIEGAPARLQDNGSLQLVALTNKGGKSYAKMMEEAFGNVEVIGRGSGFQVYKSVKSVL
jgi:16S rRNA (guanine1207-N2)-methyltransferase